MKIKEIQGSSAEENNWQTQFFALTNPLTVEDAAQVEKNLLSNIATQDNVFTKVQNNHVITSIPGAVIASPSQPGPKFSQDYFFHWVRDAAIVMNEIAYLYDDCCDPVKKSQLKEYIFNYVNWVKVAQNQPPINNINVLGEPKFNINGTIFDGAWARPQNDGPGLRAIALIHIAHIFLQEGNKEFVLENLFNTHLSQDKMGIIKSDLEYIANHWHYETADIWEEVFGYHCFAEFVQRRALIEGAQLAQLLGDPDAASFYLHQAKHIEGLLYTHWNPSMGFYSESLQQHYFKGGGVNTAFIMGQLHGRIHAENDPFTVSDEKIISTAYHIRYAFEGLYRINLKEDGDLNSDGPLIGRYPGDIYDGDHSTYGNPWILTTCMLAKYYYVLAHELLNKESFHITPLTAPFFKKIAPQMNVTSHKQVNKTTNPTDFYQTIYALIQHGDNMLKAVKHYSIAFAEDDYFHLSEQIDRSTGEQVSAKDLTWSYCTVLAAYRRREILMQKIRNYSLC